MKRNAYFSRYEKEPYLSFTYPNLPKADCKRFQINLQAEKIPGRIDRGS